MNQRGFARELIILAIGIVLGAVLWGLYLNYATTGKIPSPFNPKTTELNKAIPTISPILKNSTQTKIAYVKDGEVVIKILETNEELKTSIPINWEDPKATWCQGFDWSPDGTKIFARLNPISIYDLTTKKLSPIQNFPNEITRVYQWGPDSKSIYTGKDSESGTWIFDFTNTSLKQVSKYSVLVTNLNYPLSYDGKKIVLSKDNGKKDKSGNFIKGGIVLNLETGEETGITLPANASARNPFIRDVAWSPDNYQVAYVYDTNFNDNQENRVKTYRHIGVFNLNTKVSEELPLPFSSVRNPVYSPNGDYLLFENEDSPQELWISNKDGANPKKIADNPVDFYKNPSWLADSKSIVYGNVGEGIFIVNIDGSNRKTISAVGSCPIISPK